MHAIGEYLLSVTGGAIICSVVLRLLDGKGSAATIGKMVTGIFMALTVIGPIAQVRLSDGLELLPHITADAQAAVAQGKEFSKNALAESISTQLEAYILDRAKGLGVTLTVEVELSDDTIPVPVRVKLRGNIAPYTKSRLQQILQDELGIDKENQIWT